MDLHEANMRLSSAGGVSTPGGGPMVTQEMEGLNKTIEEQKKIIEEKQNAVAECEKKIKELEDKCCRCSFYCFILCELKLWFWFVNLTTAN